MDSLYHNVYFYNRYYRDAGWMPAFVSVIKYVVFNACSPGLNGFVLRNCAEFCSIKQGYFLLNLTHADDLQSNIVRASTLPCQFYQRLARCGGCLFDQDLLNFGLIHLPPQAVGTDQENI